MRKENRFVPASDVRVTSNINVRQIDIGRLGPKENRRKHMHTRRKCRLQSILTRAFITPCMKRCVLLVEEKNGVRISHEEKKLESFYHGVAFHDPDFQCFHGHEKLAEPLRRPLLAPGSGSYISSCIA